MCPISDSTSSEVIVFFSPTDRKRNFAEWLGSGTRLEAQEGSGLGEREHNAFTRVLGPDAGFGYDRAVVIGTDCPVLDNKRIEHAFSLLDHHDVVIGPAEDGGYFLLGLSAPRPGLFSEIDWGTSEVLEKTIQAAINAKLDIAMLNELYDVDTIEDLRRLARELERDKIPNLLPETTSFLAKLFR